MESKKPQYSDYFILDGDSRSYDLREEIKSWGGYWIPLQKTWAIDCIAKDDTAYKVLTQAGLSLQWRKDRLMLDIDLTQTAKWIEGRDM